MFDDPKKELQRLQGELLAAENPQASEPEPVWEAPEDPEVKKKRFAGLLLALVLETLALIVVVAWWLLCR